MTLYLGKQQVAMTMNHIDESAVAQKVDKVTTPNIVYGTDSNGDQTTYDKNSFGQVDDVKVNGTSVVDNKVASITLGTMANETASEYTKTSDLATVATSGSYNDLSDKPSIPAAQVNSDWNATSGVSQILNKPTLGTMASENTTSYYTKTEVDGKLDDKQNIATAVNYDNITNCITEIPQDIKLELNNGTLTLKAGSKVYVPNGFEANGVTPKFDEYLISSDLTFSSTTATEHKCMLFIKQVNGAYGWVNDTNTYSGTDTSTKTSIMCYRTDLNRIIYQNDVNAANYSFPICIFKYLDTVTSIDQVFNGFGYIGSTVFALPGIKGLIPNGRNSDGTLKNIEFVNSSVKLCNNTVTANNMCLVIPKGANSVFDGFKYIASEEKPTSNYTLWYNPTENTCRWKTTGDFGNTPCIYIGSFNRDSGKVTSFTPKTAFHAVDWNDRETVVGWGMPDYSAGVSYSSNFVAPTNGYCVATNYIDAWGVAKLLADGGVIDQQHNPTSGTKILTYTRGFCKKGQTISKDGVSDWGNIIFYPCIGG